jgi:hypothetical protein
MQFLFSIEEDDGILLVKRRHIDKMLFIVSKGYELYTCNFRVWHIVCCIIFLKSRKKSPKRGFMGSGYIDYDFSSLNSCWRQYRPIIA